MQSKLLKKVLTCALVITLVSAPMTVGATGTTPPPAPSSGSGSSSSSSSTAAPSPVVVKTTDSVMLNGAKVVTTVEGHYYAKNVAGVAVTTPIADVNAALGVAAGEKAQVRVYKSGCGKLAQACVDSVAATLGVPVGPMLDIFAGKVANGKYTGMEATAAPVRFTVGVPANFKDAACDYAVVRVQTGGAVTVLVDQDNDPNTVTFDTTGFGVFAIVKAPAGGFDVFR